MLAAATVLIIILAAVVGAFQCRFRWVQFPSRRKSFLILAAGLSVAAYACMLLTGWRFTPRFSGSEQESDEVPNWRWFQDLGSPADVGGGCDHGLWTANRLTGCRS